MSNNDTIPVALTKEIGRKLTDCFVVPPRKDTLILSFRVVRKDSVFGGKLYFDFKNF